MEYRNATDRKTSMIFYTLIPKHKLPNIN